MMGKWVIGSLAGALLVAAASPTAAQTRPRVSGSESTVGSGPTCVIGGVVSDCEGGATTGVGALVPAPVIIGAVPVEAQVIGPFPGVGLGGSQKGDVSNDVDVDRSTRSGTAAAR